MEAPSATGKSNIISDLKVLYKKTVLQKRLSLAFIYEKFPETSGWTAEINAFALGAEMVDPHVTVYLKWYSAKDYGWVRELDETDVHIVCARDVPDPLLPDAPWGLSSGVLDIDIADCVPVMAI